MYLSSSLVTFACILPSFVLAAHESAGQVQVRHRLRRQDKPFLRQNGLDAQSENEQFATLNEGSSCNTGDNACIDGSFAQCVGGQFTLTPCSDGLTCASLPLLNSEGTSVACTTEQDRDDRINSAINSGGSGSTSDSSNSSNSSNSTSSNTDSTNSANSANNVSNNSANTSSTSSTGNASDNGSPNNGSENNATESNGSSNNASSASSANSSASSAAASSSSSGSSNDLVQQNTQKAIQENQDFQSLNENSSCTENQVACINDQFAKCANGAFVMNSCGDGLICASLPLLLSEGTSVTCTTPEDRDSRLGTSSSSSSSSASA